MVLLQSRNKSPLLPASKGQGRSGKWEYFSWFAPLINGIHPQLGYWLFSCTIYITGEFWDELRRIQTLVVGREEDLQKIALFLFFFIERPRTKNGFQSSGGKISTNWWGREVVSLEGGIILIHNSRESKYHWSEYLITTKISPRQDTWPWYL